MQEEDADAVTEVPTSFAECGCPVPSSRVGSPGLALGSQACGEFEGWEK